MYHTNAADSTKTPDKSGVFANGFRKLLGQNRDTGIGDSAAQVLAVQNCAGSLDALVAHNVGVLSHGGQDVAVSDQAQDSIGLVEADTDNVSTGSLDSVAGTVGSTLVAAEDTNDALSDVVLSDGLGLGSIAFAVLGLQQGVALALEGFAEASLTLNSGVGSSIDVHDTDGTFGDALGSQLSQHGLTGGEASSLVVGGEGGFCINVCGGVNVDDLDTGSDGFLQSGGDGIGAVGSDDDGVTAGGNSVVDLLDLLCIVLCVGGHVDNFAAQLGSGLHGTLFQGDPVLVNAVHGDQSDLEIVGGSSGSLSSTAFSLQNGNTGIGDCAAQVFALQSSNSSLNTFVTHDIGVLSHGGQDVAVSDQAHDGIGLVEADNDNVGSSSLMLTIQKVDGGLASQFIHDTWQVGTEVTVSAPLGNFTYEPLRDAKTVVGVVGGSSITPFRSLAMAIADGDEDCDLILLYGSRTLADTMFQADLKELEAKCSQIKLVNILSDEQVEGYEHGFITADLIRKYAPEGEYSLFVCGPQVMRNFVDKEIATLGLRKKFIRNELFGEYFGPAKEADYPANVAPAFKVTVRIAGSEQTITAPSDVSLLRSLEAAGIAAPAHCRSGECGWCHSRLVSGEIYTPKSMDGRREADFLFGYIHPCCSFPLSDLVIEVPPVAK